MNRNRRDSSAGCRLPAAAHGPHSSGVHTRRRSSFLSMVETTRYRPMTAGALSARTHAGSHGDDAEDSEPTRPTRPSTQRSTRSPRPEILDSGEGRRSSSRRGHVDADEKSRRELATLRQKLAENDIVKAQTQVADLKVDLRRQEQQNFSLKAMQASEYVLKLAEEKEALAVRVERLLIQSKSHRAEADNENDQSNIIAEMERLRTQNSTIRAESARLRAELKLAMFRGPTPVDQDNARRRSSSGGVEASAGQRDTQGRSCNGDPNRSGMPHEMRRSTDGPLFHEGQAVECRSAGSESWRPSIIDSARLTIETLGSGGGGGGGNRAYVYTARFDEGGSETDIPENRIRAIGSCPGSTKVVDRNGERVIQSRVFRPGDAVLARDGEAKGKWSHAEVFRRNGDGSYCVAFVGKAGEHDLHPTMLRWPDQPHKSVFNGSGDDGRDTSRSSGSTVVPRSLAEEAELRYEEERESLLIAAREALPAPFAIGDEVLARYPESSAWGPGVVAGYDALGMHVAVKFDSGDFQENIPGIFLRPRRASDMSSVQSSTRPGDALLVQQQGTATSGDWFPARFNSNEGNGCCSVIFAGFEGAPSVRETRVQLLYPATKQHGRLEIPGNVPPPTKPMRAKKHLEGDLVLACIPTLKAWTPALITGVKGRGRYSVRWADAESVDSLLFMNIAPLGDSVRKRGFAITDRHTFFDDKHAGTAGAGNGERSLDHDHGSREAGCERDSCLFSGGGGTNEAAKAAEAHVRLRQRQLQVGEPVLAKTPITNLWTPGSITKADGNGKYDVLLTDGTTVADLSFLFIRGLGQLDSNGDGGESTAISDSDRPERGYIVGDNVYVLKRGYSTATRLGDELNREIWRAGTIVSAANGRFTIEYGGEEGKTQESRIEEARVRPRHKIRQKAAVKGDVVMALSTVPGRGWMMGAVTARGAKGEYSIAFADGNEEKGIRFVNLRHVESSYADGEKDLKTDKPSKRAIRQLRFRVGTIALAKHPETHKWGVVKVLEVLLNSRYDLQFLGGGESIAMGVSFQSMRHLDLAQVGSDNPILAGTRDQVGEPPEGSNVSDRRTLRKCYTDESWDELHDHGNDAGIKNKQHVGGGGPKATARCQSDDSGPHTFQTGDFVMVQESNARAWSEATISKSRSGDRYDVLLGDGSMESGLPSSRIRRAGNGDRSTNQTPASENENWSVGSAVYVLRRGKHDHVDLEDPDTWRPGKIISFRSNGTYAVQYDETGAPKEDRIAQNRLRHRRGVSDHDVVHSSRCGSPQNEQDATFNEGDILLATAQGHRDCAMVAVEACLGDSTYRVLHLDGSGTNELGSHQLSHVKTAKQAGPKAMISGSGLVPGRALDTSKRPVIIRKLQVGEVILAKTPYGDAENKSWFAATVVEALSGGMYSVLFSGDTEPERVHFAKVRPLKNVADAEAGDEVTSQSSFVSKNRDMHGDTTANNILAGGTSGVLRVADLCFKLSMAASAARRTSPRLILATGARGNSHDAPWLHRAAGDHRSDGDEASYVVQGEARPGACNPAWKGNEEGVFWLSLEGLEDPALYVGLKDERAPASKQRREEVGVSEEAIMVEACIRVPLEGVRAGSKAFEVDLKNGAGTVSLQWSTHKDAHDNNF